jgi:hypothetical protein
MVVMRDRLSVRMRVRVKGRVYVAIIVLVK